MPRKEVLKLSLEQKSGGTLEALNPLTQMGVMVVGEPVAQPANLLKNVY